MFFDENAYVQRLEELSHVLFGDSTDVEIIQSLGNSDKTERRFRDEDELAEQLDNKPIPSVRLM
jgi:hypothetical protein